MVAALTGESLRADGPGPADADEDRERKAVEVRGQNAGLRPFRVDRSASYQAVGDSGDGFRALTLRDCEAVATGYLDYYRAQGFEVARPPHRLTVVTLADDRSFAAFLGKPEYRINAGRNPAPNVRGIYDRTSNRLVVYDQRPLGPELAPRAGNENARILAHEATHQLAYNTGLLDVRNDVPACIVEGIAMFGEVLAPNGRATPGLVNHMRIEDLARTQRRKIPWIPLERLLTDDRLIHGAPDRHETLLAYAESWLLVHYLMKGPQGPGGFRTYLEMTRRPEGRGSRLDEATASLGDLGRLDRDLSRFAVRLQKSL